MIRVARLDAFAVGLPLAKPITMAGRRRERSASLVVRLVCDDGPDGWGEAAPHGADEQVSALAAEVREVIAPALAGRELADRATVLAALRQMQRCSPRGLAAVEMALADSLARAANLRVADLYGGPLREAVIQKWLIGAPTAAEDLAEVELRHGEGISFFMLKVGSKPIEEEAALARQLRDTFGDAIQLCADANGAWSAAQALTYLHDAEAARLVYLEQPLAPGDLAGAALLAAACGTPLGLDEGVGGADDILAAFTARAIGGAAIKPSKYGGIGGAVAAGLLCDTLKLKVALATPFAESSLGTAAALQVAAVLPQVDWAFAPSSDYLSADIVAHPLRHAGGRLHVPSGPGLGVTVEPRLVEEFRLDR